MSAWKFRAQWGVLVILAGCWAGCQQARSWLPRRSEAPLIEGDVQKAGEQSSAAQYQLAAAAFDSARDLERAGKLNEALTAYQSIVADAPEYGPAHHRLAVLCDRSQQAKKAEQHYRTALRYLPDDAELRCDYAYSLYLRNQLPQAETELRQVLATHPDHARSHLHLGLVHSQFDRKNEAYASFMSAGCTPAESHANIAYVMMSQSRWQDAAQSLQLALEADPHSSMVQARNAELSQILAQLPAAADPARGVAADASWVDPHVAPASFSGPATSIGTGR